MSIRITNLAPDDLPAAGQVLDAAFHAVGMEASLASAYALGNARWLAARLDGRLVGMVGVHDYGSFAYVGMMAVHPDAQRRSIGRRLMQEAIDHAGAQGVPTLLLDASAAGRRLYPLLDFVPAGETWRLTRPVGSTGAVKDVAGEAVRVRFLDPGQSAALIALDTPVFGAARPDVLAAYAAHSEIALAALGLDGKPAGYLMARNGHVGPYVALDIATAEALLVAALPRLAARALSLTLPEANAAGCAMLRRHGFLLTERLLHMRRGPAVARRLEHIYSQASLTLG